ncbi:hypothetical protein ACS7SF_26620 (plasmid) [Ralstonia sp. 25C]|uniref:hypothetical protein n=1 Tax=Ralstonia sp. 25C TaxID=3447363 RepID=UPI003F7568D4
MIELLDFVRVLETNPLAFIDIPLDAQMTALPRCLLHREERPPRISEVSLTSRPSDQLTKMSLMCLPHIEDTQRIANVYQSVYFD